MEEGKPTKTFAGEGQRRLDCPLYGQCLDHADAKNWPGWTCEQCTNLKGRGTILSSPDHFFCEKFHTTLSKEACLKRQQRASREKEKNPNSEISISLSNCLQCLQGKEFAMPEAATPTEKKDLPLCQDCGVNPADGIGGKHCRSCQGRRGAAATNRKRASQMAEKKPRESEIPMAESITEVKKAPPEAQDKRVTIDFEAYPDLFEEFKALARDNFRPLEYQLFALVGEAVKQRRVPTETS